MSSWRPPRPPARQAPGRSPGTILSIECMSFNVQNLGMRLNLKNFGRTWSYKNNILTQMVRFCRTTVLPSDSFHRALGWWENFYYLTLLGLGAYCIIFSYLY